MTRPLIVGVAGPPGSGKTTLAHALAERLDAPVLFYDAYEQITGWPPERVTEWLGRGAPIGEIPVPGLAADLSRLLRGEPVPDRDRGGMLRLSRRGGRRPVILFDTLLGRAHAETGAGIDHLIWLDVPLDVALARKLQTFTAEACRDPTAGTALLQAFDGYLGRYDTLLRPTYLVQREQVRPGADLILPCAPAAELLAAALDSLPPLTVPVVPGVETRR